MFSGASDVQNNITLTRRSTGDDRTRRIDFVIKINYHHIVRHEISNALLTRYLAGHPF
jgi:hypothetical protein